MEVEVRSVHRDTPRDLILVGLSKKSNFGRRRLFRRSLWHCSRMDLVTTAAAAWRLGSLRLG